MREKARAKDGPAGRAEDATPATVLCPPYLCERAAALCAAGRALGNRDGPCRPRRGCSVIYQLPKPRPDGQTVLSLTPMEFEAYIPVLAGDLLSLRRCAFLERLATSSPTAPPASVSRRLGAHRFAGSNGTALAGPDRTDPRDGVRNAPLRAAVIARAGLPMEGPAHASSRPAQAPTREVTETSHSPSTYWWAMCCSPAFMKARPRDGAC